MNGLLIMKNVVSGFYIMLIIFMILSMTTLLTNNFWYEKGVKVICKKYSYSRCRGNSGRGNSGRGNGSSCILFLGRYGESEIGYSPSTADNIYVYLSNHSLKKVDDICISYQQGIFLHGNRLLNIYQP